MYELWTSEPRYGSPLADHLPLAVGIPTTKDVLGYYVGAPKTLTYYDDILRYRSSRCRRTTSGRFLSVRLWRLSR